ncbi:MAG TPA: protein kinase [Pyrinomonadaceae bacterium]|nr:protein kinase [Pyrinomonadaceae bacterium]
MLTNDQVLGKGRYRIISSYTNDECGGLYEAYDTVSNTNVVLRESGGSTRVMTATQLDELKNAFAGEAKALKEIRHESLLSVQDYFSEIDRHYLVMEPVDGSDFTRFLKPDEAQPALSDVLSWTEQLLDALQYLHTLAKPIFHRDIRPASVRLTSNFKVKLLTAGIGPEDSDVIMASAGNPSDSSVLNYRPLEQLWGGLDPASQKVIANSYDDSSRRELYKPLDARSDIYSLGATLYHVLSRTLPKDALERSIEILDGKSDPLSSLSEVAPSVPVEVSEFVMKALELKRENRFESAAKMHEAVSAARGQAKTQKPSQARITPEPLDKLATETKAVDADVERERLLAEARRKELEAEQNRIEEEQKNIEAKRLALQAEEKKKRAAADPTKTSETKKQELKTHAVSNAVDDQLLLEVEPVETPAASADSFEWSEEELYVSEAPSRRTRKTSTDSIDVDFGMNSAPGSNFKFVAAGAGALIVVLAIVGWMFMGGSSTSPQAVQTKPEQAQPAPQEQAPVAAYTDPNASTATQTQPETSSSLNQTTPPESQAPNSTTPSKQKKPTPTPGKAPEKKKVTVDDLINDN